MSDAVLITGCSTGIGRETAEHLAGLGEFTVYATARRVETLSDLESAGCRTLVHGASSHGATSSGAK